MKRKEQASISNLALGAVGLFALLIVGTLGMLVYKVRARQTAAAELARPVAAVKSDEDAPVIRIASRVKEDDKEMSAAPAVVTPVAAAPVETKAAEPAVVEAAAEKVEAPTSSEPAAPLVKVADANGNLVAMQNDTSDLLIPSINGVSYTTKKMLSNGLDPNNPAKPGSDKPAGKKPDAKKSVVPVPPKAPVKVEAPKVAEPKALTPTLPPLPAAGEGKIDFSKAPIYVLNDGRRLRAVIAKETNGVIAIRNEAGKEVTFKKSDVKEIIKN